MKTAEVAGRLDGLFRIDEYPPDAAQVQPRQYRLEIPASSLDQPGWVLSQSRVRRHRTQAEHGIAEDPDLIASPDFVPVKDWIERSGLTAEEQWLFGFGLSGVANAWDETRHPRSFPRVGNDISAERRE